MAAGQGFAPGTISSMIRTVLSKVAIAFVCGAGTLVIAVPLGLYVLGLSNIEGRPEPPTDTNHVAAHTALLQQTFRSPSPVVTHVLNPWTYAATLLTEDPKDLRADNGSSAVWLIARDYNYNHLKNRKMSYWHLSGAALTIWVSRNWTTAQVVTAAAAIARSRPKQSLRPENRRSR
jgi:hypothetical protein